MPKFQICGYVEVEARDEDHALEVYDPNDFVTGEVIRLDNSDYEEDEGDSALYTKAPCDHVMNDNDTCVLCGEDFAVHLAMKGAGLT